MWDIKAVGGLSACDTISGRRRRRVGTPIWHPRPIHLFPNTCNHDEDEDGELRKSNLFAKVRNLTQAILSFFMQLFLPCAFSCGSSSHENVCRSSCIVCRQKASRRCVKACEASCYWSDCKNNCTDCMQRALLQCVWDCVSWDFELLCRNICTDHIWKASLLNWFACVSWGY